ncbi:MAG: DUF5696 domain-containing protein [Oscillospiraceae bacterium]
MAFYKRIAYGLLSVIILLSLTACGSSGETYKFKNGDQRVIEPKNEGLNYHQSSEKSLEPICSSGLVEMYFDKSSYSVVIKETSKGNMWYSIPTEGVDDAAVITLDISHDGSVYKLNSQDNSLAFGKAKYEKKKDGVHVSYTLCEKKNNPKISIPVTVKYTLKDGSFFVDINCDKLDSNKVDKVEKLELLKYFGATKAVQDGDFMLLPDGCGAKINTAVSTKSQSYNVKIYGEDYASANSVKHSGVVPAFGVKSGTAAFGAVIRSGDSISSVVATKAAQGKFNTIGTKFSITPTSEIIDGDKTEKTVSDKSYNGNLSVCYRFLAGSNATYSGIASVCREQLIRDAVLSTKTVEETGSYPINISFVGEAKYGSIKRNKLTNFEQAQDIVELLKAKGINNLNLRYSGAFSGGTGQSNLKSASLLGGLGSKKEINSLYDYMTTQGFGMFLDINMLTMDSGSRAEDIRNKKVKVELQNDIKKYLGPETYERNLIKPDKLEKNVVQFLTNTRGLSCSGFCINDAGSILYSDFSGDYVSREKIKSVIQEQIVSLSTNTQTMAKTGNFFMLKNIDYVVDIPMDTTYKQSQSYECIPFIQMILHGMIEYSGEPVNLAQNYTKSFLKSIEYGNVLAFEMAFEDLPARDKKSDASNLCYEQWASKASEGYKVFNDLFADLRDARMTNHYIAAENLSCTVYDNDSYIYVNYSPNDITYNNLVIKANSYLRVS